MLGNYVFLISQALLASQCSEYECLLSSEREQRARVEEGVEWRLGKMTSETKNMKQSLMAEVEASKTKQVCRPWGGGGGGGGGEPSG